MKITVVALDGTEAATMLVLDDVDAAPVPVVVQRRHCEYQLLQN